MKISCTVITLFFIVLRNSIRCEGKSTGFDWDKVWQFFKNPIPAPCYIPDKFLPDLTDMTVSIIMGICVFIILIPFPKIFFLHNLFTIVLGMTLFSMHVIGIIFGNSLFTIIISVPIGLVCGFANYSQAASDVILLVLGTYTGSYALAALFGVTCVFNHLIAIAVAFGLFFAIRIFWSRFFLISVKTSLILLCIMSITETFLPFNLISTIHGNTYKIFSLMNKFISKFLVIIGGVGLYFYNFFLSFYCS